MTITRQWIMGGRSRGGGWTRIQLDAIGVPWPPQRGWIDRVCGRHLSADRQRTFETGRISTLSRRTAPSHRRARPVPYRYVAPAFMQPWNDDEVAK